MDFKFPDVGEGIAEGKLVSWKVKVGDTVKKDDPVCEVETDKAVVEIPAPENGTVSELLNKEGDMLNVGEVFMKIDGGGDSAPAPEETKTEEKSVKEIKTQEQASEPEVKVEEVKVEDVKPAEKEIPEHIMENAQEIDVAQHVKEIVASPSVRQLARDLDVDIKTVIGSGVGGKILEDDVKRTKDPHSVSTEIPVDTEEPKVEEGKVEEVKAEKKPNETDTKKEEVKENISVSNVNGEIKPNAGNDSSSDVLAMPRVRNLAKEKGIDLANVKGSGAHGEIMESDLGGESSSSTTQESLKEEIKTGIVEETKPETVIVVEAKAEEIKSDLVIPIETVKSVTNSGPITLTGIRGAISSKMMESLSKTAQVTICDEANITDLVEFRNSEKDKLKEKGIKLTYLPFFMKAFVAAAKDFPKFNSVFNEEKNQLEIRNDFNLGIATDTQKGLLVPNIFNCETKSIIAISKELTINSNAAREGKLDPKSMQNGTFTFTSIGSLGGQFFTPILNYPQIAILGIGRIIKKPIVKNDDEIGIAEMVSLSLTFDHRLIDGAEAAKFLKRFMELIEDVEELLIE